MLKTVNEIKQPIVGISRIIIKTYLPDEKIPLYYSYKVTGEHDILLSKMIYIEAINSVSGFYDHLLECDFDKQYFIKIPSSANKGNENVVDQKYRLFKQSLK